MSDPIKTLVIVGGGTAGWLTAGLVAAEHRQQNNDSVRVVLVESPDVGPIGVGEGTWPTMRSSLETIGLSESDFIRGCESSFKQGTRFTGWRDGGGDFYYHPFALPPKFHEVDMARHWQPARDRISYADAVTPQGRVCEHAKAPKLISTPEYAGNLNYGFHLDAGQFSKVLQDHCIDNLGVNHILANVTSISSADNGDIKSLALQTGEVLGGDLFVDCTGFAALLLGEHFGVPVVEQKKYLFNDTALAVQVARESTAEAIASATHATAQSCGWIWDIGLPTRRGIGHVFASAYTSEDQAEQTLRDYVAKTVSESAANAITPRKISFQPGHRQELWHRNCLAIGLSAGFVEPLEASALVMIELSAKMLAEQMPANRDIMDVVARRFNEKFLYHWQRIVEFLKLHYVLSNRTDSDYWQDNRGASSIPAPLRDSLKLWKYQSPRYQDLPLADELFPAASYRYVLYGMGFESLGPNAGRRSDLRSADAANKLFIENNKLTKQALAALPGNRELIEQVQSSGFPKV